MAAGSPLLLARDSFLCVTEDYAVILDLESDEYLALDVPQMRAAEQRVLHWPTASSARANALKYAGDGDRFESALAPLIERGILTFDRAKGKSAQPVAVPTAHDTLVEGFRSHVIIAKAKPPRAGMRDLMHLTAACAAARRSLRTRPIRDIVHRIADRKAKRSNSAIHASELQKLVSRFMLLRPLFYTRHDRCLFDSLALVEFLARHDLFPTWVFGIQTGPFVAHCWVQHQVTVFNDTPERVRRYTPIMAI